jgi:hypothetical protein
MEIYDMAWVLWEEVAFEPIFPEQTFALGLNRRKNWGWGVARTEVCIIIKQSQSQVWFGGLRWSGSSLSQD